MNFLRTAFPMMTKWSSGPRGVSVVLSYSLSRCKLAMPNKKSHVTDCHLLCWGCTTSWSKRRLGSMGCGCTPLQLWVQEFFPVVQHQEGSVGVVEKQGWTASQCVVNVLFVDSTSCASIVGKLLTNTRERKGYTYNISWEEAGRGRCISLV